MGIPQLDPKLMDQVRSATEHVPVAAPKPASVGALAVLEEKVYDRPVPTGWKMAVDLRLKNPGLSWKEIAKAIGYSYQTVLLWVKRPEYQRYEAFIVRNQLSEESPVIQAERKATLDRVREKIESHSEEMLDRLLTIIETAEEPALQAKVAQDWLDRAGAVSQRAERNPRGFTLVMQPDVLQMFFDRAKEAGLIVDGEVVEVKQGEAV